MIFIPTWMLSIWLAFAILMMVTATFRSDFTFKEAFSATFVVTGAVGFIYLICLFIVRFAQIT